MTRKIYIFLIFLLLMSGCIKRESIDVENNDEPIVFPVTFNVPEEFYGKWKVTEYINGRYVGQYFPDEEEILGYEIEFNKDSLVYNGDVLHLTYLCFDDVNVDYDTILTVKKFRAFEFMDKEDTATVVYLSGKTDLDDSSAEEISFGLVFTSSGGLYMTGTSTDFGKLTKIE